MSDAKLWKAFSQYIRLKHSDENGFCKCYTCGAVRHWKKIDCGHGIGRQHKATKFDEKNNRPQCKHCNGFEGGKREEFKKQMDLEHGPGTWELMELKARQTSKRGQFEFDALEKHYKKLVIELLKQKHLEAA